MTPNLLIQFVGCSPYKLNEQGILKIWTRAINCRKDILFVLVVSKIWLGFTTTIAWRVLQGMMHKDLQRKDLHGLDICFLSIVGFDHIISLHTFRAQMETITNEFHCLLSVKEIILPIDMNVYCILLCCQKMSICCWLDFDGSPTK